MQYFFVPLQSPLGLQMTSHRMGDKEVRKGFAAAPALELSGQLDNWRTGAQSERQDGVCEVVPIDDDAR